MSESDAVVVVTDCFPRGQDSVSDDVIVLDSPVQVSSRRRRRRNRTNANDGVVDLTCLPSDSSSDLVDLTSPIATNPAATTIHRSTRNSSSSSADLLIIEPPNPSASSSTDNGVSRKKQKLIPAEEDRSTSSVLRLNCPICLEPLQSLLKKGKDLRSTVCGHVFCDDCIKTAIRSNKKCPTCRKKLTEKQTHRLYLPIG